ncbi:MAG: lipoate--protein ligase family protein, partial [Planctomycetota bacterium]
AVQKQVPDVVKQGVCDLTIGNQKFSGNSLRITRGHVLYHGTILHDADLDLVANCLGHAPRQPEYRGDRDHRKFITNLSCDAKLLGRDLADAFGVVRMLDGPVAGGEPESALLDTIRKEIQRLVDLRYGDPSWYRRH